ncbi:carbonic anhydrase family protein [Psychrobacter frigidicola]|uniref:carbonic anhydrase n=1 Tax=Psychrobacter frigidicola TaxID=45611 RepID=A0A5C7A3Q1_9GAMM|nr:carbonic anhydrase family protein [Psychrobacter frigidicola]TXD98049.1 carbonic anhydrase family protein [Psychrobacter frigidicola]
MQPRYLAIALMTVSALGFTACSNNYKTVKGAPTGSGVTVVSPVVASNETHHRKWSYAGDTGPESWGNVDGASACKIGTEQSPININNVIAKMAKTASAPTVNYSKSSNLRINDNGHTIVYTPTAQNNIITINNERFELKQFHYHTPSEHQFGGQSYPSEIHFVHANSKGNLAVIGVMLQVGQPNDALRLLLNGTELAVKNDDESTANKVDLSALIPAMPIFYHYTGSLTTPPCSEEVQWYVTEQPLELASDQLAIMTDLYQGNNRPIQSQGSRVVEQLSN